MNIFIDPIPNGASFFAISIARRIGKVHDKFIASCLNKFGNGNGITAPAKSGILTVDLNFSYSSSRALPWGRVKLSGKASPRNTAVSLTGSTTKSSDSGNDSC